MTGRPELERRIALTTIGSDCVEIEVAAAPLQEASRGATLWVTHWRETPLEETTSYTLTETEAKQLVAAIADVITPWLFRLPDRDEASPA